ncbi:MAG: SusC/RagA family TonB-linked outer membrane protein, partial [Bacteroidaceae bacterium]
MKKQLVLLLMFFLALTGYAQRTVTGVVTSADDEMPIIGASILVKGTTQGTISDFDGKYSIKVADNATLVFTYVGMEEVQKRVGNQSIINVMMKSSSIQMEEVVVTAMGVKAEKKKLNFAVQSLDAGEITAGQSSNFISSLQGKVAGVRISGAGGSPNAGTSIQIRAISSINPSQNNEPLFIIDGIAVNGSGSNMANINPNDIENMTILKGAAASALYGQDAANGVVMITTKSGKDGAIQVNANASVQIDNCARVPKMQNIYGPGSQGFYKPLTNGGWGPLIQPGERVYDNVDKFLGTGVYQKYDVSVSGGTDRFTAYGSINYTMTDGVVADDYKNQLGALLKTTFKISKHLKVNMQANITNTQSRGFGNSMKDVYAWPINDDMRNYQNPDGSIHWRHDMNGLEDSEKIAESNLINPYWKRNVDTGKTESTRNILMGSINYTPIKNLEFSGRVSYDQNNNSSDSYEKARFKKSDFKDPATIALSHFGKYNYSQSKSSLLTAQALATYQWKVVRDFDINILAGCEVKDKKSIESKMGGDGFIIPGDFNSIQNLDKTELGKGTSLYHINKRNFGYFGELRFDYKGIAHASVTARNDYSSTLSKDSYFYPSVTAGLIFSELFHISNDVFSYGKIRGNWARVGKDANPYLFDRKFRQLSSFPDQGFGVDPTSSVATYLDPEMCDSWELGVDLRFFNSWTRLDVAYYSTLVKNQIVNVRVSPAAGNIL